MTMCILIFAVPTPSSLTLTTSSEAAVVGSNITLICTLVLNPAIVRSENALLMVNAQLSRDGTPLALTGLSVTGTTFTYTTMVNSFGRSDSGNYTCNATVRPLSTSLYLTGIEMLSSKISVITGKIIYNIVVLVNFCA